MQDNEIQSLLDEAARRINVPGFVDSDPVQFPRRYQDMRDIEIVSLLCSTIAWGRRDMICRDCERLLEMMHHDPYHYLMHGPWERLDGSVNIHRTFFVRDLQHYLRGLKSIYGRYGSLEALAASARIAQDPMPAWALARALSHELSAANDGESDGRCLPTAIDNSALKRLNMALRWLVRRDGIVDMGVWDVIKPSQLFIPMDVHVGRVSRALGLLERKSTDARAAVQLTEALRRFDATDPVRYDFALFGLGIEGGK